MCYTSHRLIKEAFALDIRRFEAENTVSAENQLRREDRFSGKDTRGGVRLLFVGNSITLHAPKPEIGWTHNWGMAASSEENDYVHQTMSLVRTIDPLADFRIAQIASWERAYWEGERQLADVRAARDWHSDIVIIRLCENTPEAALDEHPYAAALTDMMNFFTNDGEAKLIVTDLFWPNPRKDVEIQKAIARTGAKFVRIGDLGVMDSMKAIGLFEHTGVAAHPGDLGMKTIALRLFDAIKPLLVERP